MKAILTVHNIASDLVTTFWTPVFVGIFIAIVTYALVPVDAATGTPNGPDIALAESRTVSILSGGASSQVSTSCSIRSAVRTGRKASASSAPEAASAVTGSR